MEAQGVIADQPPEETGRCYQSLGNKDQFMDKVDQYKGNDKAELHNATDDHELDTPMEEVPKVYIAYMLEVKDEEDCDEREIVAKHTCGLSRRTVVSPSREGSCGNPPWSRTSRDIREGSRRIGLSRGSPSQVQLQVTLNQDF